MRVLHLANAGGNAELLEIGAKGEGEPLLLAGGNKKLNRQRLARLGIDQLAAGQAITGLL